MALFAMPVLLMNMGGEMLYILEQRLQAQAINNDKSKKVFKKKAVLQDVIRTLFNSKFLEELMKPQALYSMPSLRGVFDRLAHSSIMRLSESSMDKLFDLMTMGVKYQVVASTHSMELVEVTLNHLHALHDLLPPDDKALRDKILEFCDFFKKRYAHLPVGEFMELRQTLHAFFQDRRVKVSLFLQLDLQAPDGHFILPTLVDLPPGVMLPNTIRYYASGNTRSEAIPYIGEAKVRVQPVQSKLGLNLYSKQTKTQSTVTPSPTSTSVPTPLIVPATPQREPIKEIEAPDLKPTSKIGASELNLLAQLINNSSESAKEAVKVNLFAGDTWGQYDVVDNVNTSATIVLDPTHEKNPYLNKLMDHLSVNSATPTEADSGQDLLDLMDSVG